MKKKTLLLLLCAVLLLSGCTRNVENNSESETDSENNSESAAVNIETMDEELPDLKNYSVENDGTTDFQPEFLWANAASNGTGIYYWGAMNDARKGMLMYYDLASQTEAYLCNRPDCTHSDDDCNASFYAYGLGEDEFYREYLFYYDGNVYLVGHDNSYRVYLYKVAPDGSSWERYMKLYKVDRTRVSEDGTIVTTVSTPEVCIHRGYVYFIDYNENVLKLRRMKLGGTEAEVLYEADGEHPRLYRLLPYGDYIFFQTGNYINDTKIIGTCACNANTGEVFLIKKDVRLTYILVDEILYYEKEDKIHSYSLITGEDEEVLDISDADEVFFADSMGIYIYNSETDTLVAYDHQGEKTGWVGDANISDCYFGRDGIFFGKGKKADGTKIKAVLDVESLLSGDGKWIYIK